MTHPQELVDAVDREIDADDPFAKVDEDGRSIGHGPNQHRAIAAIDAVRKWDAAHPPTPPDLRGDVASVIVGAISDDLTYGDDPGVDDHADAVADDVIRLVRLARANLVVPTPAPDVPEWVDELRASRIGGSWTAWLSQDGEGNDDLPALRVIGTGPTWHEAIDAALADALGKDGE